jgi:hypothetical protein
VFTIEEEVLVLFNIKIGLKGATNIKENFINGSILINIDTATEGLLTVG